MSVPALASGPVLDPSSAVGGSPDLTSAADGTPSPAPTTVAEEGTPSLGTDSVAVPGPAAGRDVRSLRETLLLQPFAAASSALTKQTGWVVTAVVTLLAAVLRLVGLNHPRGLMFDEIYYVKDAYALWQNGYESKWADGADQLFAAGDFSALKADPAFVVHPQLGKWLIALGMQLMGTGPVGWRLATAVAGTLMVLLLIRLTLRLSGSVTLAGVAGLLLSIDGVALTESRIGLLDGFVGLFGLLSLYCLVRDRQWLRERLARELAGTQPGRAARLVRFRPWLLAAGISLGLTCSIKWSGIYLLAVVGLVVVVWDFTALRAVQAGRALLSWLGGAVNSFVHLVVVAVLVYVAGWWSWFLHPQAYNHGWAATERALHGGAVARSWLPDQLNDLLEYHLVMWNFHVHLDSAHPYQSKPIGWLVQLRPTSFYWPGAEGLKAIGQDQACGSGNSCVQAITSIGNIPIWWAALPGLAALILYLAVSQRDWRAWVPLAGYLGLYVPWFLYPDRTIFTFYTVSFVPEVVLALVLPLGAVAGLLTPLPRRRMAAEGGALERLRLWERAPQRTSIVARPAAGWPDGSNRPCFDETTGDGTVLVAPPRPVTPAATLPGRLPAGGVLPGQPRPLGMLLLCLVVAAAIVFATAWWPLWTGQTVSYDFWSWHMLFRSWI